MWVRVPPPAGFFRGRDVVATFPMDGVGLTKMVAVLLVVGKAVAGPPHSKRAWRGVRAFWSAAA